MKLNRLQKWIARVFKIVPFDIDQALREKFREGKEAAEQKQAWPKVYPQGGAYDHLGPVTDKPTIIPSPHGRYFAAQRKSFMPTRLMPVAPKSPVQFDVIDESWLNSEPLTKQEGVETEHVPALSKLLHGGN